MWWLIIKIGEGGQFVTNPLNAGAFGVIIIDSLTFKK